MSEQELPVTPREIVQPPSATRSRLPRRHPLERVAMLIMALGAAMMFQPFAQVLFSYSFIVILLGTIMFTIVSHFPD